MPKHLPQCFGGVIGIGMPALAPLFVFLTRPSAVSVGKSDDGTIEFRSELHQPHRFSIAFGPRTSKIPKNFLLGIATLLLGDDHQRSAIEPCHSGYDRVIVG